MNPNLAEFLSAADQSLSSPTQSNYRGPVHVGVDLGTAYTGIFVLDQDYQPLAGAYEFTQVVRDGLVVDFAGAVALVRKLKQRLEDRLGFELTSAATAYPPGVPVVEVRAGKYVLEASGLECSALVEEPTAANAVLQIEHGAVVDIGGGTTGIAVVKNGEVVYTADEPTGGTHFTLVISGAHRIPFEDAEALKTQPSEQGRLFPVIRPVMEKVGSIIERHIRDHAVGHIYLVGGTSAFLGIADVITNVTGVEAVVPGNPLWITPLGIAMHDQNHHPSNRG
ncbi:MAG: ethanolamine utilization protein EutJ [Anaerolineaceae bacterium]|jgi:ethanolamine utilization protein EutJ